MCDSNTETVNTEIIIIKTEVTSSDEEDDIPLLKRFGEVIKCKNPFHFTLKKEDDNGNEDVTRECENKEQKVYRSKTSKCKDIEKTECPLCGEKYYDIKRHLEKHSKRPAFDCDICGKSFTFKGKLLDHKKFNHGVSYACEICQKKFNSRESIRIHMSVHATERKFVCEVCGFSSKRKNGLEVHMMRHEDKWLCRCAICNKGFFSHTKLAEHMNNHTGEKPFTCDQCGCSYSSSNTLWIHARKSHPELFNNLFSCKICRKVFMKEDSFEAHLQNMHSKGDHFECEACTKTFTKESSLIFHRRTHTNERPYVCKICGGAFTAQKFLTKHRSIHRYKNFKCRFCYKKFMQEHSLLIHEQKHTEVK